MLEITDSARQLIRSAFRRGRVVVVSAPWRGYAGTVALVARWSRADDEGQRQDHVRVGDGDGDWIYLRADLLPVVRQRRVVLEPHSIFGLWPGIAVRTPEPVPVRSRTRPGH